MGADCIVLKIVKKASEAASVIACRAEVADWRINPAEAMLYDRLISRPLSPAAAVKKVGETLNFLGVRLTSRLTRKPVLVCVRSGRRRGLASRGSKSEGS